MGVLTLDNCTIKISGHLDFSNVPRLWNESLPLLAKIPEVHFDFTDVIDSNSAGLSLLLEWVKLCKSQNKKISFENIPAQVLSIARVSGVDKILHLNVIRPL